MLATSQATRAAPTLPGDWSHAALRRSCVVLSDSDASRAEPPFAVALPWHFRGEVGSVIHHAPTRAALAGWGDAWPHVVAYDRLEARAMIASDRGGLVADRALSALQARAEPVAQSIALRLRHGLEDRAGEHLRGVELAAFVHLGVRAGELPRGIRVCETCNVVHRADRAERCPGCRRVAGRLSVRAHHVDVRWIPAGPDAGNLYVVTCAGCDRDFTSGDARQRHCSSTCRVRAHRAA